MSSITTYLTAKKRFGAYYGLFYLGLGSLYHIKYTVLHLVILSLLEYVVTCYHNQLLLNIEHGLINYVALITAIKLFSWYITYKLFAMVNSEQVQICHRLTSYINTLYKNAPYSWHERYTNAAQKKSISDIFYTYDRSVQHLTHTVESVLLATTVIIVSFYNRLEIGLVSCISSYLLYKLKKLLDGQIKKIDDIMANTMDECQISVSNQFTNRTNIHYVNAIDTLLTGTASDPVAGLIKTVQIWDNRNALSQRSTAIIKSVAFAIMFILSYYLYSLDQPKLIVFVVMNRNELFGFLNVVVQMEEINNLSQSRAANTFKMLDELAHLSMISVSDPSFITEPIDNISIECINKLIKDEIRLVYQNKITLSCNTDRIILLDGPKGCGKTVTMNILAGMYDGFVSTNVSVNNHIKLGNELRDLRWQRMYMRQCVVDDYKHNCQKTICMTLAELFVGSTREELVEFLAEFDLLHKIPADMHTVISINESGLSPGESQSIIWASHLWMALKLNLPLLLLDEPERNIDYDTVRAIFTKILHIYHGIIILTTHSPDLKTYLQPHITQVWQFHKNVGTNLGFVVQSCNH